MKNKQKIWWRRGFEPRASEVAKPQRYRSATAARSKPGLPFKPAIDGTIASTVLVPSGLDGTTKSKSEVAHCVASAICLTILFNLIFIHI